MVDPHKSRAVAVYCGSSISHQKAFQQAAVSVAQALVATNRPLVYGGGNSGIMGVVSGVVASLDGGQVTGVIPHSIYAMGGEKDKGRGEPTSRAIAETLDERQREGIKTIFVSSMHERKIEMAERSCAFIGLPGGFGTFEEILEVVTWNQLGIHNKPVVLVNVLSYYDPLRELIQNGVREGFIQPENERLAVFVDGPADHAGHETFDWGRAAVEAIDAWGDGKSDKA